MEQNKSLQFIRWSIRILGLIAMLIGGFWLFAWLSGYAGQWSAQGALTGIVIMKTNMALALMLSGLILFFIGQKNVSQFLRTISFILASVVLLIGFLTLSENLLHIDLRIDQLLAHELPGAAGTSSPNRMGLIGSISLSLIGAGLLLVLGGWRRIAFWFGVVVCFIILLPSVGYLLDIDFFFSTPTITGVAWPTVIALLLLGLGLIIARHNEGVIAMIFSDEPSGVLLRRLLPAILIIPSVIGFLVLKAERSGLFDIQIGMGVFIVAMVFLFLVQALRTSRAINLANSESNIAKKELEKSEKKYRDLVLNAPAGIYEIDFRIMKFTTVNDSMCLLTGYSRDEFLSMSPFELLDDAGKKAFQARTNKWLSGEKPDENIEYSIKAKDGHIIYAMLNVKFKADDHGNPAGALVVAHDITELRKLENEIKSVAKFPTENPNPVLRIDNEGRILFSNDAGHQILKNWNSEIGGNVPNEIQTIVKEISLNETPRQFELDCFDKIFFFNAVPVMNARYINLYGTDETERKKSEEALRQSEERFRMVFENASIGMLIADADRNYLAVNEQFCKMMGSSRDELICSGCGNLLHPDDQAGDIEDVGRLLRNEVSTYNREMRYIRHDGAYIWGRVNVSRLPGRENESAQLIAIIEDITERKRAEDALRASEGKYRMLFDSIDEGFCIFDMIFDDEGSPIDYRFVEYNTAFERHTGLTGAVGKRVREFLPDQDRHWFEIYGNVSITGEPIRVTRYGEALHRWIEVYAFRIGEPEQRRVAALFSDVTKSRQAEEELRLAYLEMEERVKTRTSELQATTQNLMKLNEEFLRSNKDLENFAYIASHDLQEPLRMVSSFSQLLEKKYEDKLDKDAHEYIYFVVDGARRMQELLNGLLSYSRIQTKGSIFNPVNLNQVLSKVQSNLELIIKERGAIINAGDLPEVFADEVQMIQVFQNLILNSIKFCESSPRIFISSKTEEHNYTISLADNGIGIEPQYSQRIFLIFQRLHSREKYEGTGIGLAICKRIIERHGGTIWVESEPGKGSTFSFTIPRKRN
jgi:PAS domain S-box-containing protein